MESDIQKATKAALATILNARRFFDASKVLFEHGKYREAYLMALYSGEEMGKVVLIVNYPCYTETADRVASWKKRFLDHTEKFWFLRNVLELDNSKLPTGRSEDDNCLKNQRLEICYVDYRDGNFVLPLEIACDEALVFLNNIEDRLLRMEERHPNYETVEEQIVQLTKMRGKSLDDLLKQIRELGFS